MGFFKALRGEKALWALGDSASRSTSTAMRVRVANLEMLGGEVREVVGHGDRGLKVRSKIESWETEK